MPELVHAWAETLDGQVSRGRCGIVTLTYLFSRDGKETCPLCRKAESGGDNGHSHRCGKPPDNHIGPCTCECGTQWVVGTAAVGPETPSTPPQMAPEPSLTDAQLHAMARAHTGIMVNGVWDTSREPQPGPQPIQTPEVPIEEGQRRIALLRACIAKSGMSNSAYARDILIRPPRTIRRWLAGDAPIPHQVMAFLYKGG